MNKVSLTVILLSGLLLTGCSSDKASNSMNAGRSGSSNGMLTLAITDAAVDSASEVWIQFTAIELKPASGPSVTISFDTPVDINLLTLQGSLSQDFFNNEMVPGGSYDWMRLLVNASNDGVLDSYIVLDDGNAHELSVPSGNQTGLQINGGFSISANTEVAMTLDFDLRKSIVVANGKYLLKPVLRLIENASSGSINGSIDSSLTMGANCSDSSPVTGNAVYVFAGSNAELDDMDNQLPEPVTTALLTFNTATGLYDYEVGFLPEGSYTVAYTCMADLDNPEVDDEIFFQQTINASVSAPIESGGAEFNR